MIAMQASGWSTHSERHFGAERVRETGPAPASEDFGSFGSEWHAPSVFWFVGGTDPDIYAKAKAANRLNELPVNHSPKFAPGHSSHFTDRRRDAGRRDESMALTVGYVASTVTQDNGAIRKRRWGLRLSAGRREVIHVEDSAHMRQTFRRARARRSADRPKF